MAVELNNLINEYICIILFLYNKTRYMFKKKYLRKNYNNEIEIIYDSS